MDFACFERVKDLRSRVSDFMAAHVLPANTQWHREVEAGRHPLDLIERLKAKAYAEGLWNLFLPALKDDEPGTRLTNLEYAPLAEIMGRIPRAAEVFNCNAPDTGNMEILHMFATPARRQQWLAPGGAHPLLRRHHRTGHRLLRPHQPSNHHPARRRRLRHQRPQVVHHRRQAPQQPLRDRDGPVRSPAGGRPPRRRRWKRWPAGAPWARWCWSRERPMGRRDGGKWRGAGASA